MSVSDLDWRLLIAVVALMVAVYAHVRTYLKERPERLARKRANEILEEALAGRRNSKHLPIAVAITFDIKSQLDRQAALQLSKDYDVDIGIDSFTMHLAPDYGDMLKGMSWPPNGPM